MKTIKPKTVEINSFVVRIEYTGPKLIDIQLDNLIGEVDSALDMISFNDQIRKELIQEVSEIPINQLKITVDVE